MVRISHICQVFFFSNAGNSGCMKDVIETDKFTLLIHENSLMEILLKENIIIDEQFVVDMKERVEKLKPGKKFYVLSSGIGFFQVTNKARRICSTAEYNTYIHAVAFYTTNFTLKIVGELYNKLNKPVIPTRIFQDRNSAEEWLFSFMGSNTSKPDKPGDRMDIQK
jgi:hypothetical protein